MKILFAIDPWVYRDCAGNQMYTLEKIFIPAIKTLNGYGHDVNLLLGEDMEDAIKIKKLEIPCKIITISLKKLYDIYHNHYEAHLIQYHAESNKKQKMLFKELMTKALGIWYPDVIFSFTTPVSAWKECYPKSLSLQFENGMFSREPYPYLVQLDPYGFLAHSYPSLFLEQLRNHDINRKQSERLENLRDIYKKRIFYQYNPISKNELKDTPQQKILLVPLSYNGVVINDAASNFRSQLDFLLHVLYNIPPEIIVLVTKHSLQMNNVISEETENFLVRKFPNIRFNPKFDRYAFASQWLTPLADGIVTLNSTLAYHAVLWGKKVFTLGKCEINTVATSDNLKNIEELLNRGDKDDTLALNVIYHLLTRYCFTLDKFLDPGWLTERLKKMIYNKNGNLGNNWDGLPLLDNEDIVFNRLLTNTPGLKEDYSPRKR